MVGVIGWIVIGLLAGGMASLVLNRHHGLFVNLVIGLIGAVVGGWINNTFVHFETYGYVGAFVVALAGSVILLALLGLFRRPRSS